MKVLMTSNQLKVALKHLPIEVNLYSIIEYFEFDEGEDKTIKQKIGFHIQVLKKAGHLIPLRRVNNNVIYQNLLSEVKDVSSETSES